MQVPQGEFRLHRWPRQAKDPLRAWDAADEYLLQHIAQMADRSLSRGLSVLMVNDAFGALSVALAGQHRVWMSSDSFLAHQAVRANLESNGLASNAVEVLDSLTLPEERVALVVLKIPKSHGLLEDQLFRMRPLLADGAVLLAAGMSRAIHTSTLKLFERIIGPTRTSLAKKKARLIFSEFDAERNPGGSPWPSTYRIDEVGLDLSNHAGVFSARKLDIGTRFMLQHLPESSTGSEVIDLGCGNGALGIALQKIHPEISVTYVDESFMAVDSARRNHAGVFPEDRSTRFVVDDCLQSQPSRSADLILINPPFHQQHAVTTAIARRMFKDARRVLRPGGECRIVANRHLGYHQLLRKLFNSVEVVASNSKFVVLSARAR